MGDKEQTLAWLDRAYSERDGMLVYLGRDGAFAKYRSEPRFVELLQKVGVAR